MDKYDRSTLGCLSVVCVAFLYICVQLIIGLKADKVENNPDITVDSLTETNESNVYIISAVDYIEEPKPEPESVPEPEPESESYYESAVKSDYNELDSINYSTAKITEYDFDNDGIDESFIFDPETQNTYYVDTFNNQPTIFGSGNINDFFPITTDPLGPCIASHTATPTSEEIDIYIFDNDLLSTDTKYYRSDSASASPESAEWNSEDIYKVNDEIIDYDKWVNEYESVFSAAINEHKAYIDECLH